MKYRKDKYGNDLSILGYGCMRFPKKHGKIDMTVTEQLLCHAVKQGINYYDTAYIYPGSEAALGEIFERNNLRHRIHIATKLPHYLIKNSQGLDKLFTEELRRLRTDYIDYYLMHMLNDIDAWQRLRDMGIEQWIAEKKQAVPSGRLVFLIMAIPRCSARFWMLTTGTSARCSIIIWTNTLRLAAGVWSMPTAKEFPSLSWSLFAAASW